MLIHYFLVGLPALELKKKPRLSPEDFLLKARDCLDEQTVSHLELLRYGLELKQDQAWASAMLAEFCQGAYFSGPNLNDLNTWRRQWWEMLKQHPSRFLREFAVRALTFFEGLASDNFVRFSADPLVFEEATAAQLWQIADECARSDEFHTDQVLVYFIRLLICQRLASFSLESGQEILQNMIKNVSTGALHERAV